MNKKAPRPNGFKAGQRIGDPVALLRQAEGRRARGRFVGGGGDQRPDRLLVRLRAEIGLHEPRPAAARPGIVGLERGRRGLGRLEALKDEVGDGAGAALVADEAHHVGGVVGRQAFEHAKPNTPKRSDSERQIGAKLTAWICAWGGSLGRMPPDAQQMQPLRRIPRKAMQINLCPASHCAPKCLVKVLSFTAFFEIRAPFNELRANSNLKHCCSGLIARLRLYQTAFQPLPLSFARSRTCPGPIRRIRMTGSHLAVDQSMHGQCVRFERARSGDALCGRQNSRSHVGWGPQLGDEKCSTKFPTPSISSHNLTCPSNTFPSSSQPSPSCSPAS